MSLQPTRAQVSALRGNFTAATELDGGIQSALQTRVDNTDLATVAAQLNVKQSSLARYLDDGGHAADRMSIQLMSNSYDEVAPTPIDSPLDLGPTIYYAPGGYDAGTWTPALGLAAVALDYGTGLPVDPPPNSIDGCPAWNFPTTGLFYAEGPALTEWGTAGNKTLFAVVDLLSLQADAVSVFERACLIGDSYQNAGLLLWMTADGSPNRYWLGYYECDPAVRIASVEITGLLAIDGSGRLVAQGRKRAGHVEVRANGGGWVVGDACGDTSDNGNTGFVILGSGEASGIARAVGTFNRAISNTESGQLLEWAASV